MQTQDTVLPDGETAMRDKPMVELPFLRNIGFVVTYRCQVACPHCIIKAGPHRTEEMHLADAMDWIGQVSHYRGGHIRGLALTGGEPFVNLPRLKAMADAGRDRGLLVSAVTNAFWATSSRRAVAVLEQLDAIGVLSISCDVYHQMSIPFDRVRNAVLAAQHLGIQFSVSVCTENVRDLQYRATLNLLREIVDEERIDTAMVLPVGRALEQLPMNSRDYSVDPPREACSGGASPIVFPDGKVIACIGPVIDLQSAHPLNLGNLRTAALSEILDSAETNPVLHAIRVWGPRKLVEMARASGLERSLPAKFMKGSACIACHGLMANAQLDGYLASLMDDDEFRQTVAYARIHYLGETRMAELMRLGETGSVMVPTSSRWSPSAL